MIQEEIEKIKEYCKTCKEISKKDKWLPEELEGEIRDFVNGLIHTYGWTITADDTHRWNYCDGFYEVEFTLNTEIGDIYINTECGDQKLEEWSSNNPQRVELYDCCLGRAWDWYYFLENLYATYERK